MHSNPELSIVILCYRSEEGIIPFAEEVKATASSLTDNYEIVLVGNYIEGSNDRTKEIVETIAAKDPVFRTICKPKKGMMGWDMKEGLALTKGDYLCVIDGDGQFPVESIAECYNTIKSGDYGLVKTYRKKRNDGFSRSFISRSYNLVFKILFPRVKAKDINSKPKIFKRSIYDQLKLASDDWFIDAEIMIKASRLKVTFHEFPIEFRELKGRKSFVNFPTIFEFIRNLISFRFRGK